MVLQAAYKRCGYSMASPIFGFVSHEYDVVSIIGIEIVTRNFKTLDSDGFNGELYQAYKELLNV